MDSKRAHEALDAVFGKIRNQVSIVALTYIYWTIFEPLIASLLYGGSSYLRKESLVISMPRQRNVCSLVHVFG